MITYIFKEEEEISHDEFVKQGNWLKQAFSAIERIHNDGKGFRPSANNPNAVNDNFRNFLNSIEEIINYLNNAFSTIRTSNEGRDVLRNLGNTPNNILKAYSNLSTKKVIEKAFSKEIIENLLKLSNAINVAEKFNAYNSKYGTNFKDFSKEIKILKTKIEKFLDKRLCSIITEMNYFNY